MVMIKGVGVSENSEFGSPLSRAINLDPITPLYETDPDKLASQVFTEFPVVRDENGVFGISELVTSEVLNPVAALQVQQGFGSSDKIVGNIFGELQIIEGLKIRSSFGTDLAFWGGEGFNPVYYLNASNRNDINSYGRNRNRGLKWVIENTISYKKLFGKHDLWVVLGTSAEDNRGQGISGAIQDIPVDNIEEASLAFFNQPDGQSYGGYEYEERLASYFGRFNYNFSQKYLLSLILRVDGSSRFLGNNRFGFFPVASLGWVLTEEDFLINNNSINYLKLRGSWGINGNKNTLSAFDFVSTLGEGRNYTFGNGDNLVNGIAPNSIANPDLKWEETYQTNIGFDARFLKKFSVTLDVYQKRTEGGLAGGVAPIFIGNSVGSVNIRSMENSGIDLELGYNKSFRDYSFSINGNISYAKNEVTFLNTDVNFLPGRTIGPQGLQVTRTEVGRPIGFIYGFETDGIYQNEAELENALPDALRTGAPSVGDFRFKDLNNDGEITNEDRTLIGDPTPTWTYGFTLNGSWKNFDLILFGQGIAGNDIYNGTRRFDLTKANHNAKMLDRWTGEGTSTEIPRMTLADPNTNFGRASDFFVESGAFFRIKTLQLGFNLPTDVLDKLRMKKLRLYVSGNNLFTFTKYQGLDPEIGSGFGIDLGFYPHARFYLFGASITL